MPIDPQTIQPHWQSQWPPHFSGAPVVVFIWWRRWTATKRSAVGSMWRMGQQIMTLAMQVRHWLLMCFVLCDKSCKSMRVAKPTKMPDRVPSLHADATTHFAEVKLSKIAFFPFNSIFRKPTCWHTKPLKKHEKTEKKPFLSKSLWAKNPPPARANATASVEFFDFFTLFTAAPQLRLQSLEPRTRKSPKKSPPLDPTLYV